MTKVKIVDNKTSGTDSSPSSVTELTPIVQEFIEKLNNIKHEQELLKQDEKDLWEEYGRKLDLKALKAAMKVLAVKEKVEHKDAFESILECLERI